MTYKQAYDKIIDAYFKDEIQPMRSEFCFCGTLSPDYAWRFNQDRRKYPYNWHEYSLMEDALFEGMHGVSEEGPETHKDDPLYEDALFAGMCAALEVLKQIHIDRGEVIDPLPTFTKRVFSDQIKVKNG